MSVEWNRNYEHEHVVAVLESTRSIRDDGKARYEGLIFRECSALIYDLLTLKPEIPESEGRAIVNRALMAAAPLGPVTPDSILKQVRKAFSNYLRRQIRSYFLATSISLSKVFVPNATQLSGTRIIFGVSHPRAYAESRASLIDRAKAAVYADLPANYMPLRIRVVARSPHEASDYALDRIDEVRGLWNLFFNRGRSTRISIGSQDPINSIVLGPLHSLHKPRGELATDTFWYEPSYRAPVRLVSLSARYEQMTKFYSNLLGHIRRSKYGAIMRRSIIAYARALDERDWHASYLKLWSVLEVLTSMGPRTDYRSLVRRSANLFKDHDFMREALDVLRVQRNRVVHASSTSVEIETYLYQLKMCVEIMIEFHLGSSFRFKSVQQAMEFLDLPPAREDLDHKAKLIDYAQKYRGYKPRDPN